MLACIAADAERRATTTRYQLRYPNRYVTATYTAPIPTCPALPATETRTATCPTGTTGTYPQTRSYTAAPYPTCSTAGAWTPAEPPAGACVAAPPPTSDWTLCAVEYQTCTFTGTRRVRFGLNASWVERDLAGPIACRINTFGSDPVVGAAKRCELRNVDTPPPPATGTATLSWTPPTANTDGTALSNLAGYRISYGASPTELINTIQIPSPSVRLYTVENLSPGTYYFSVRAYTSTGTESAQSNTVSKAVP